MVQPRYKKFVKIEPKPRRAFKKPDLPPVNRGIFAVLFLLIAAGFIYILLLNLPVKSSLGAKEPVPDVIGDITEYSQTRWILHGVHTDIITADVAWFRKLNSGENGADLNIDKLNETGFNPFIIREPDGALLDIGTWDINDVNDETLFHIFFRDTGENQIRMDSRKSFSKTSVLGKVMVESEDETIMLDPMKATSIFAQFLPKEPKFEDQYVCYLAQVWDSMAGGYARVYQKPPSDMQDILNGIGLSLNPDCAWPFDEDEKTKADLECGIVDGKIIYWKVFFSDGTSGGQAKYWDQYTQYDDPETPANIFAGTISGPVVDPSILEGTFDVIFSLEIYHELLMSVKPLEVEGEGESS